MTTNDDSYNVFEHRLMDLVLELDGPYDAETIALVINLLLDDEALSQKFNQLIEDWNKSYV